MRHKIEHRTTIACHNDSLSLLNLTGQLSQTVLGITDVDSLHILIVATHGYKVYNS